MRRYTAKGRELMAETIKRGQRTASASPVGGVTGDMNLIDGVAWLMLRGLLLLEQNQLLSAQL